jgi:hypothetical protein
LRESYKEPQDLRDLRESIKSYKESAESYEDPTYKSFVKSRKLSLELYKELMKTAVESNKRHKKHIEPPNISLEPIEAIDIIDTEGPPSFKSLLEQSTKVCCYYHNKYRPSNEMIEVYMDYTKGTSTKTSTVWICPSDNLCRTLTKP